MSALEPALVTTDPTHYHLNIDIGNKAKSGTDGVALGTIGNSSGNCIGATYESRSLKSSAPITVTTDANGKLWVTLTFAIDSGFGAESHLYLQTVTVQADPVL